MKYKYLICLKLFILIFFSCKKSDESKWKDLFIDNSKRFFNKFGVYNKETNPFDLFISGSFDLKNMRL